MADTDKIIRGILWDDKDDFPETPYTFKDQTVQQQRAFTEFITDNREYCGWYPAIMVLLGTGMRIGECLGLRWTLTDSQVWKFRTSVDDVGLGCNFSRYCSLR